MKILSKLIESEWSTGAGDFISSASFMCYGDEPGFEKMMLAKRFASMLRNRNNSIGE
ncbi:MAG: hypothetical protein MJ133_05095 [Lachnospiraceae bacterium]|nr:hypothetical protein [Lachnospiraceae bacterium]